MTRPARPWHFFLLILPYGASFGCVSVTLPYFARLRGVSVDAIAALVAAAFAPHAYKFLWAPIVDTTLGRKTWYAIGLALVALGTWAILSAMGTAPSAMPGSGPGSLRVLTGIVVATQIGLTLLGMACEGMLGHGVPAERKGTAAAWLQSGSLLGVGIGGGAGIELTGRLGGTAAGAAVAVSLMVCATPFLFFDEPEDPAPATVSEAMRTLLRDLLDLVRSRRGLAALVLCLSPVGSGAASNLFGAIAGEWHASLDVVALATGALGGTASAAGAIGGGWITDRIDRRLAYVLAGALTAASAVAMALGPRTAWAYVVFTLVYQAFNGFAFAAFSAFAFGTIGRGAVATKYNVLASLANLAITYATRVDGLAHAHWGGGGVLLLDAAMTAAGIAVLGALIVLVPRPSPT